MVFTLLFNVMLPRAWGIFTGRADTDRCPEDTLRNLAYKHKHTLQLPDLPLLPATRVMPCVPAVGRVSQSFFPNGLLQQSTTKEGYSRDCNFYAGVCSVPRMEMGKKLTPTIYFPNVLWHIFGPEMPCGQVSSQDGIWCVHPTSFFPLIAQEESDSGSY